MRWHQDNREEEKGAMRHPTDSMAWKHFNEKYPQFAQDHRNVRLGLASDGFTPWSNLGNSYSMWHVILICYNLLTYMFMKEEFLMMSLLILFLAHALRERILMFIYRPLIDVERFMGQRYRNI